MYYLNIYPDLNQNKGITILNEYDMSLPLASETEPVTPLQSLLASFRDAAVSEREKGTYFEKLIVQYLLYEPDYSALYSDVWEYGTWARDEGKDFAFDARDDGIDLVAKTHGTEEYHAIQCKFYAADHTLQKADIDSFFTASGQQPFTRRIIVATTNKWSNRAEQAIQNQQIPTNRIKLEDLEDSRIDWSNYTPSASPVMKEPFALRPHQRQARDLVCQGLESADRGKMIMACGTGKTLTSLKIAEQMAGANKRVLFMVPSLALLSQTLTEWSQQSSIPMHCFAVCSDTHVGKRRRNQDDIIETLAHDLSYPATTTPERLAAEMAARHDPGRMSVVFSTYQSIDVLYQAQLEHDLPSFDLIVCDEAHRTTGAVFDGIDESHFVRIHNAEYIRGTKRLYMTATPRIYGDVAKAKAEQKDSDLTLCSMDDAQLYGYELYVLSFSEAVQRDLLVDYKVIVLAMDEAHISRSLQTLLADEGQQLRVDDAAKIVGCWKALSKDGLRGEDAESGGQPMQRAVAFCQVIEHNPGKTRTHRVSSKHITAMFKPVIETYLASEETTSTVMCEADHIDGTMNASIKQDKLSWLKSEVRENHCRILSNVRCLSEGVDVPALDAVLFLTPRNSQVDVVQSVGRVMRKAPGKKRGYVILPVVIPAGIEPEKALNNNVAYKVVWQVLQALRSHDDQFNAHINKLEWVGSNPSKMEVIAVTDNTARPADGKPRSGSSSTIGEAEGKYSAPEQNSLSFKIGEIEQAIYAKVVQKCGRRLYWEDWATDIADIAKTHITRITAIVRNSDNTREAGKFKAFADELRDDLNDSITDEEVIEMLAQHLITRPVFDALFGNDGFARLNPVSKAMQGVLEELQEHHLESDAETLERFYRDVSNRASGIDAIEGKQRIVVELYDKFFRKAFPRMTERLGIVYTPVEVVDFIIHSVNDLLQKEFGQTLGSEGVHILDPFVGTGTFITRLMQSGLIKPEELPHKYQHEIHANEIVLLAYYIAAINIETVYHDLVGQESGYQPFEGICLTDTFQMYETKDMLDQLLPVNSARRKRQVALPIRVIMGNPPYSAGQKSENDNAKNVAYPSLDQHIRETYALAARSRSTLKKNLYDSYIRAIRWGSDRLGDAGIIAYVINAGWLDGNSMDGLRKCLVDEFSSLYVFHLRGDQRTSGETSRREGGKIFGSGSRAQIAIMVLVKTPRVSVKGRIYYHDIGDYLSRQDKLDIIRNFHSVNGITTQDGWETLLPDENHDWLNQANPEFDRFLVLGDKKDKAATPVFRNYSFGVVTNRDAWCYNASKDILERNIHSTIAFYNAERERFHHHPSNANSDVASFVNSNPIKISWSSPLKRHIEKNKKLDFSQGRVQVTAYRPFSKQWGYHGQNMNHSVYQTPKMFPNARAKNRVICVSGVGAKHWFSTLMVDAIPSLDMVEKGQCFPLILYDRMEEGDGGDLFQEQGNSGYRKQDGISDTALTHFQSSYPGETINKEDLFYYLYGILHSEDYRDQFRNNLMKQLPRLPVVLDVNDFHAFRNTGRSLAELHLGFESVKKYDVTVNAGNGLPQNIAPISLYRVEKMKHGKIRGHKTDLSKVIYNAHITLSDIPLEAYDYVVNGKSAIKWVMDRQGVITDKKGRSGIVNDANCYANETMKNPAYPLELLQRIITVSIETMKVVRGLPPLRV